MNLSEELRKVLLTGIGVVVTTGEKTEEIINAFAAKGELTMEQGKVLNQKLQCTIKKTLQESEDTSVVGADKGEQEGICLSQILDRVDSLIPEELAGLKTER